MGVESVNVGVETLDNWLRLGAVNDTRGSLTYDRGWGCLTGEKF